MEPKEEIAKLRHGERWVWSESDYGKASVYRLNDVYILFSIPEFGGDERYEDTYDYWEKTRNIDEIVARVNRWT